MYPKMFDIPSVVNLPFGFPTSAIFSQCNKKAIQIKLDFLLNRKQSGLEPEAQDFPSFLGNQSIQDSIFLLTDNSQQIQC